MKYDNLLFIVLLVAFPVLFYFSMMDHNDFAAMLAAIGFIGTLSGVLIDLLID